MFKKKRKKVLNGYRTLIKQQSKNPQVVLLTLSIMLLFQVVDIDNILQSK